MMNISENEYEERPLSTEEFFGQLEENPQYQARMNLIILILVMILGGGFIFFGPSCFRVDSQQHFLAGLPLCSTESLHPLVGTSEPPSMESLAEKTVLVILWGPWDHKSCHFLAQLKEPLKEATRNSQLVLLPVAYLAVKTLSEEEESETPESLKMALRDEEPFRRMTERAIFASQLPFSQVWWDPQDIFRTSLVGMALQINPKAKMYVDGIGFPTLLLCQNGVITHAWGGGSETHLEEIHQQLKILSLLQK
ncbi:MAG: hypothetical protein Q4D62_05950 [Planctomycetia bacterium]|nr:hypothetical protein [Planctomycetia bacterium]